MPHPIPAVLALSAALLLPLTVAAPAEAAGTVTATPTAAPHLSAHQRHLRVLARKRHLAHLAYLARAAAAKTARARVVAAAERYLGQPYSYGRLDCSSLVDLSYLHGVGKHLPRTAAGIQRVARRVSRPALGDVVMWGRPAYHVAIWVGNGRVIVARHSGTRVQYQRIWGSPTYGSVLA